MFLWFIKKFMKNSYKKYLEELDEFNHLKMEIIKNCDYYNKVGTTQYHFQCFNTPRHVKIEFKRIGNKLNQLTRLCNEGIINTIGLEELKSEVSKIWQLLNLLTQKLH